MRLSLLLYVFGYFLGLGGGVAYGSSQAAVAVLLGDRVTAGMLWERAGVPSLRFSPTPGADTAQGRAREQIEIVQMSLPRHYWGAVRHILDAKKPVILSVPDGAGLEGRRNLHLVRIYVQVDRIGINPPRTHEVQRIWGSFSGTVLDPMGRPPLENPNRVEHELSAGIHPSRTRVLDLSEAEPPWPLTLICNLQVPLYFESQLIRRRSVVVDRDFIPFSLSMRFDVDLPVIGETRMHGTDFSVQESNLDALSINRTFPKHSRCGRVLANTLWRRQALRNYMPTMIEE